MKETMTPEEFEEMFNVKVEVTAEGYCWYSKEKIEGYHSGNCPPPSKSN